MGELTRSRRLLARAMTTVAAWLVAFLIVWALLTVLGDRLESLPYVLNALVFTGALVPVMGNLVMPGLSAAITAWVSNLSPAPGSRARRSGSACHLAPRRTTEVTPGEVAPTSGLPAPNRAANWWRGVAAGGSFALRPIGWVESPLTSRNAAPKQGDEGSPEAWLVFEPAVGTGLDDLCDGAEIIVLTWLDLARRDVLRTRPRDDPNSAEQGVFSTRSPDRPNPIGLHRVTVMSIEALRIRVRHLEALDGTPILDLKPVRARTRDE